MSAIAIHDQRLYYHRRELVNFRRIYERRLPFTAQDRLYTPREAVWQFFGIPEHNSVGLLYQTRPCPEAEPVHAFYRIDRRGTLAFKAKGLLAYLHTHSLDALQRCFSGLFRAYGWSGVVTDFPLTPPKPCATIQAIPIRRAPFCEENSSLFLHALLKGSGDLDASYFPWEILRHVSRACLRISHTAMKRLGSRVVVVSGINAGWSLWATRLLRHEFGVKDVLPVCLFLV